MRLWSVPAKPSRFVITPPPALHSHARRQAHTFSIAHFLQAKHVDVIHLAHDQDLPDRRNGELSSTYKLAISKAHARAARLMSCAHTPSTSSSMSTFFSTTSSLVLGSSALYTSLQSSKPHSQQLQAPMPRLASAATYPNVPLPTSPERV